MSKKLYNPNKPEDLADIHRLLEASDEDDEEFRDENFENESDIDSEDNFEEREEDRKVNKRVAVEMKTKLKKIATFIWEKIKPQSGIRLIDRAKFVGDLKTS